VPVRVLCAECVTGPFPTKDELRLRPVCQRSRVIPVCRLTDTSAAAVNEEEGTLRARTARGRSYTSLFASRSRRTSIRVSARLSPLTVKGETPHAPRRSR